MRHIGVGRVVFMADEGRRQTNALRDVPRSEDPWSPTPLSLTSADHLAAPPRSDHGQRR
jgi:hypothetical protein